MNVRVCVVTLFLVAASSLDAQVPPRWSLAQCIAVAKEHSLTLRAAHNTARVASLASQELVTTAYPQVKLGAMAVYAPNANEFGYDPAISNGGEYAGQLIVQQSVYDGGVRGVRADQLKLSQEQQDLEIRKTERDLVAAVRQCYLDLLRTMREQDLEQESVARLEDYLALVRQQSKGGTGSATDLLKTEVQLGNARLSLQRAEESSAVAMIQLKDAMGLPQDTTFLPAGSLQDLTLARGDSLAALGVAHAAGTLDLTLSELEVQKSALEIALAQTERHPTVSLMADAGVVTSGENLRLPRDERDPIVGFSVGATFELPLFNWGATDLRVEQKEVAAENARLEHEQLRRSIGVQVTSLRLQLVRALERVRGARDLVTKARDNFLLTKAKYATGSALSLEVLTAQDMLTDSAIAEAQALVDVHKSIARIDQLLAQ